LVTSETGVSALPVALTDVEQAVLRSIRLNPGRSRAQIAAELDLSRSMLTKAVSTFDAAKLIREERTTPTHRERGQPPISLSLNPDAFNSIGIYVSDRHSAVVLADLGGTVRRRLLRERQSGASDVRDSIIDDVAHCVREARAPILGVGHAVPGIVGEDGHLFDVTPSQAMIPFVEIAADISARFQLPVFRENASYGIAGFESLRPGSHRRCVFNLTLDYGVGGGLAVDGVIFRGAFNQAANIGALVPETGPRPSLTDLARHLSLAIDHLTEDRLTTMLADGHPGLLAWIDDRGRRLSVPMATVVQFFNPDLICVGGFFPAALLEQIRRRIDLDVLDTPGRRPLIKPPITLTELLGPSGFAEAAALLPIASLLLGQKTPRAGGRTAPL
jgi:predicted NBD/HSP70 family sugar kinase